MKPIWLQNMEWMMGVAKDGGDKMAVLYLFSGSIIGNWIDRSRDEDPEIRKPIAARALSYFSEIADWSMIQPPLGGLEPIVQSYRRLGGIV